MHRFKLWVLKCWFWSVYTFNFFTIHEKDAKFGYLSIRLEYTSRIFTNFLKNFNSSCVHILSCGEDTLSVRVPILVHLPIRGGDDLWTNWPFLKKVFILWCRWQFLWAEEPEILFRNINEGINCKIFLWLCCSLQ